MGRKTTPGPESLANLKPFQKGQSGNPNGVPKLPYRKLKELAEEILNEPSEDGKLTKLEAILRKWYDWAMEGDHKAAEMLFDRGFGKPTQHSEVNANIQPIKPPIEWVKTSKDNSNE